MSAPPELLAWVAVIAAAIAGASHAVVAVLNRRVPQVVTEAERVAAAAAAIAAATEKEVRFSATLVQDNAEVRGALTAMRSELNQYRITTQNEAKECEAEKARLEKEITRLARKLAMVETNGNGNGSA